MNTANPDQQARAGRRPGTIPGQRCTALVSTVVGTIVVLVIVAACGGGGGKKSHPAGRAATSTPETAAGQARVAAASIDAPVSLQDAVNTCIKAITVNIGSQGKDKAISTSLKTLLGKKAARVFDVSKVIYDTTNNTVEIRYEKTNGQLINATFDAGRVIFAILSYVPGFKLFGIIGDPAIYCTEAAFLYTGQLGGELGLLLRSKLQPPSTATSSIEGTWSLVRSSPTVCAHFPDGCAGSPIRIRLDHCTRTQCTMQRTDGVWHWQTPHVINRHGTMWLADFHDTAIACHSQLNPAEIIIKLAVTSTYMRSGVLSAKSLGGTYAVKATVNPPTCVSNGRATYALHGSR